MNENELAARGGPRTIRSQLPLSVRGRIYGLQRAFDLLPALPWILRGITTIPRSFGPVKDFEEAFSALTGARYALSTNNGTAALHSAYFAVGVKPGTEVIVPAYTWHASATPVLLCGAKAVFCEIDPRTLTADPEDIERRITPRTRAICVTHLWGNVAEIDRIADIAERHGVALIEDCSHAHGASYRGRSVGTWGQVGCFSFQGSKAAEGGEAGVAITSDPVLYDRMLLLGHNGRIEGEQKAKTFDVGNINLGVKYRPHMLGMVWGRASLRHLERRNRRARRVLEIFSEELAGVRGIRVPETLPGVVRGGFYGFVFDYQGEELGGPGTEEFVKLVRAEGAPISLDQYRGALLHRIPLFRSMDRRELGGCLYDPTRPWEENLATESLPVTERTNERLVLFPPTLYGVPESFVRGCAQALKKVLAAVLPAGQTVSQLRPVRPEREARSVASASG
jgi:perosamine synthetase